MPRYPSFFISLADLYLAYRKAKVEAFYENTHFRAIAFTQYEQHLHRNLQALLVSLQNKAGAWAGDPAFLGAWTYMPKALGEFDRDDHEVFYRALDPIEEWTQRFDRQRKKRLSASFRLVITPTVDFQIISALWILKAGHTFDGQIDSRYSYGNRLRRRGASKGAASDPGEINTDCLGLFTPYFSAYRDWREGGLRAMKEGLERGERVLAVTMDLQRFYHSVDPSFLIHRGFLSSLGIKLTADEKSFTADLLSALSTWYKTVPDYSQRPEGGLPVGLSASKIIANVPRRPAKLGHMWPGQIGPPDELTLTRRS